MKLLLILLSAVPLAAQTKYSFDFGIQAGRPQTDLIQSVHNQYFGFSGTTEFIDKPGYTVGPTIGVNVGDHLGIQFGALYKPVGYRTTVAVQSIYFGGTTTTATWWEFPVTG